MGKVRLSEQAYERSTYVINIEIEDENGNLVTPVSLTWTLSDIKGNIVNSREDEVINTPTTSNDVVLSGDDLQILGNAPKETRVFTVEGTYNSAAGAGLTYTGRTFFEVVNLAAVN